MMWNPVKELKADMHQQYPMRVLVFVESGEGIESGLEGRGDRGRRDDVESGEGIESLSHQNLVRT